MNLDFSKQGRTFLRGLRIAALSCALAGTALYAEQSASKSPESPMTSEQITEYWHSGKTLPLEVGKAYPPMLLNIPNDTGVNIMIDVSHQCSFNMMWGQAGRIHPLGYRTVTNQASLDTVLDPNGKCRVRIPFVVNDQERIFPFAWYPNFKYNIVITHQNSTDSQDYTPEEQAALVKFVEDGGSLVIVGAPVNNEEKMNAWTLNELARKFDAELLPRSDKAYNSGAAVLKLGDDWKVTVKGEKGEPVQAQRTFGKGKVVLMGGHMAFNEEPRRGNKKVEGETGPKGIDLLSETLAWCAEGQTPVGGEPRLPQTMGGGGAIYPELEGGTDGIIIYYAKNQKENLLKTVEEVFPEVTKMIEQRLPSRPTSEPMYLILAAGDGGGWAVNAFKPKENGIISLSPEGLVSIYAHELAHTMSGPDNDQGKTAGRSPMPQRGEAHAGWFQGKIDAWFRKDTSREHRNVNDHLKNPKFMAMDLKKYTTDPNYGKDNQYGNGDEWAKNWYIFQKLDDRYGSTWYPRWCWVQHTRWADEPDRKLTWEESVEDMSIACGEDLFPFFNRIGIKLDRDKAGELSFQGKTLNLKEAPIEATPAGTVCIEDITDYKKPLTPKEAKQDEKE